MSKGNIRHMFPGGNTSLGFYSYYNYILPQEEATRIFVIKGGPGVGKSTFMKKIGEEMVDRGYDVEHMHCSSDNNSLDGLVIPAIKVALLDGTAPHVVDPKNPGAVDEIIHLGDFWNEAGMRLNREYIMKDNREVGRLFARAYRYLKAAAAIYEDITVINSLAMNNAKANAVTAKILEVLFKDKGIAVKEGKQRHLFASAITPKGLQNYLNSILNVEMIYVVKGETGTGTEKLLEKVRSAAAERGFDTESYYCALNPLKLEHLVIPGMNVAFTTVNKYHNIEIEPYAEVDFNEYLDKSVREEQNDALEYNKCEFEVLLNKGINTISKAKAIHDQMEKYYIPNMDFEAVQRCWEAVLARIIEYTDENQI